MFKTKEIIAKIDRIEELRKAGFNIPRMFYLPFFSIVHARQKALEWATRIHTQTPNQIFNIRTYKRLEGTKAESGNTPHVCDILFKNLTKELSVLLSNGYTCMIDAETPDNGRWAGTIIVHTGEFTKRPLNVTIEYCQKETRAMVRDADKNMQFTLSHTIKWKADAPFRKVIAQALMFPKREVVLEWTYFSQPAGIKGENLVWWEYRKY